MKTDRELLELAAKAVGYRICHFESDTCAYVYDDLLGVRFYWQPADDDGAALRLAIKLKLSIESDALIEIDYDKDFSGTYNYGCEVWTVSKDGSTTKSQQLYSGDCDAATRRAIVLCAAQLGETK